MKVVVLDDYQGVAATLGAWRSLGDDVDVQPITAHISDPRDLVRIANSCDVLVVMRERTPVPASLITEMRRTSLIVTTGMQNASIDVAKARECGITVCGTRGSVADVVEMTWALILALTRRVVAEDRAVRRGRWQTGVGTQLAGKRLGVIGLGRVGTRVSRIAQAFGMEVVGWSPNLTFERAAELGVVAVEKSVLLAESDILTVHLRLGERSRGVMGRAEFGQLAPSSYLVNTARGALIDELALAEALAAGRIAGAALDVYCCEPLPMEHPLRSAPRLILSPHMGYVTDATYQVYFADIVQDIEAFRSGTPIRVL